MVKNHLAVAALVCITSGAHAAPTERDLNCDRSGDSRCGWINAGGASLADMARRGIEVMRFWGGEGLAPHNAFMVELRRGRDGSVGLTLRDPDLPSNALVKSVPASVWHNFSDFRRRTIAEEAVQRAADHRRSEDYICTDAGTLDIDSVLDGHIEHFESTDCSSKAVDLALIDLPGMIYPLVPVCMKLDTDVRSVCASMGGDRATAAEVVENVVEFAVLSCSPDATDEVQAIVANDAVVERVGEDSRPLTDMLPKLCKDEIYFYPRHFVGRGNAVEVSGSMNQQWTGDSNHAIYLKASGTQLWRIDGGKAKLEKWTIGAFARSD
jgi:hypothetical protein